ncbi:2'-5' RNA ligase family protein [Paractinoplanes atraurantiacus]|uniref:2'-5' RNA ligase n=1 Tax=Paractinoplanes atraurantiacus TaxID=1036182 RepID=A0A285IB56_9ACTN|nr:2'-5' RNA ligase family protein [Actinoplanes atraurantiacus]SNY45202.1 2'-5' RNA ligase [Actinoplanes atraurantiacus]
MEPTHSALILAVGEAEPVVAAHRERLDAAASWGVPAHITVLYPFLPPAEIDEHVLTALTGVAASVPAFFCTLERVDWFGDNVVWLAPAPATPIVTLTAAVTARFPEILPYGGEFTDIVPHLTIGHDHPREVLEAAAADITAHLPIHARVSSLRLIAGRPSPGPGWQNLAEFPLG